MITVSYLSLSLAAIAVLLNCATVAEGNCPDDVPTFYSSSAVKAEVTECPIARDCKAWYDAGVTRNGIYPIQPDRNSPFQVYCDMETDGGGWTVFLRRQDGSEIFVRDWADYQAGFGDLLEEFWLGLSNIHRLTPDAFNTLRVELGDYDNNTAYANYGEFEVLDAVTQYMLVVKNYNGTAGDSLRYHNLMKFSTKDNDNDSSRYSNCASAKGGWWYNACLESRLTGNYKAGADGIIWKHWKGVKYSLKFAEMKVRRY